VKRTPVYVRIDMTTAYIGDVEQYVDSVSANIIHYPSRRKTRVPFSGWIMHDEDFAIIRRLEYIGLIGWVGLHWNLRDFRNHMDWSFWWPMPFSS